VAPLGYDAIADEIPATVAGNDTVGVDFALSCLPSSADPRGIGFWKHQVGVALGGSGHAQIEATILCDYLDAVAGHFNSNVLNPVVVYVPPASGDCPDKLDVARELLNLKGNVGMLARARQQLMALLMNVAADYLRLSDVISDDGATVSQAITYCDLVIDDPQGDYETAKTIADIINSGGMVPAGMIPLNTPDISYARPRPVEVSLSVTPNPGAVRDYTFSFSVPASGRTRLEVYNVAGRKVATLASGSLEAGRHQITWNGRTSQGGFLSRGVYFGRLTTTEGAKTVKFVHLLGR
jgi:hypothetical protein